MVRGLISLQDEINKRRSKALHLLSVRQVVAEQGAVQDVDKARREVARPDGYVEVMPGLKFEIEHGGDLAAGPVQVAAARHGRDAAERPECGDERHRSAGTERAGDPGTAGGRRSAERAAGGLRCGCGRGASTRVAWMAAREYWSAGKWVRVTDDLGATTLGRHQPADHACMDQLAAMPEQQRAMVMQRMQLVPDDPRLQQVVGIENDITDLDVDITVEEGSITPTQQAEEFQTLVQLARMQPGLIPGDVLIAASSAQGQGPAAASA